MKNFDELFNQLNKILQRANDNNLVEIDTRTIVKNILNVMDINHFDIDLQSDISKSLIVGNFDFDQSNNFVECLRYLKAIGTNEHDLRNMLHLHINKDYKSAIDNCITVVLKMYLWLKFGRCKKMDSSQYLYTEKTKGEFLIKKIK